MWCIENNLALNTTKTKELIIDCRRKKTDIKPLFINGDCVERASNFRFLGVHLDDNLTWSTNTTATIKKAQQRLYFLRILRKNQLTQKLLVSFCRCTIESILTYCICVWFSSCTVAEEKALQRVVNMAQKIIGCPSPSWKTGIVLTVSGRHITFSETHLTPDTLTLNCCPQADGTE